MGLKKHQPVGAGPRKKHHPSVRGPVTLCDKGRKRQRWSRRARHPHARMSKRQERKAAKELVAIVLQQDGKMAAGQLASLLYQRCPASKEIVQSYKGLKGFIAIPELEGRVGFADNQVRASQPTPPSPPPTNSALLGCRMCDCEDSDEQTVSCQWRCVFSH